MTFYLLWDNMFDTLFDTFNKNFLQYFEKKN